MNKNTERGVFAVEARWEQTHESPGAAEFFPVDEVGGTLDEAKAAARAYHDEHIAGAHQQLAWVEGLFKRQRCYYAHTDIITFRISAG